jgi:hypothetical protein
VIDLDISDVCAQAIGILLGFLGGIVERIGFYLIFIALAVLGIDDCLVEIQIIVVGKQAIAVEDGCLNCVGHNCTLFKWFNLCPLGLFDFYVHIGAAGRRHANARNFKENFEKPHFLLASPLPPGKENAESVSKFSAEIVQRYLQDAACANFAK